MSLFFKPSAVSALVWETATDWNKAVSESGVVHESVTNTDHSDAARVKMGYSAASPLDSADLTGLWLFHEDSGTTAYDVSGNFNDGSINGPTIGVTGLLGTTAYSFAGTNSEYVNVGDPATDYFDDDTFTIITWFNTSTNNKNWFVGKDDDANGREVALGSEPSTSREIVCQFKGNNDLVNNNVEIHDGAWHQLAVTKNGQNADLYFDGGSADSTSSATSVPSTSAQLNFGRRSYDGSYGYVDGDMAGVWIYGTDLTASQIQTHYDVVNATGALTTATKSFSSAQDPDLTANVTLNGVTDIQVDVIGSPGTASEEIKTVRVTGDGSFNPGFTNTHTDFRCKMYPDNEGDLTRTPTINKLELKA